MSSINRTITKSCASKSVVKSAARVLKILEYFDNVQCEANVVDICKALGYPQSSTSLLLRTMVTLGYLQYNANRRAYIPASRVAFLGTWVNRAQFRDGNIYRLFDEVSKLTGQVVTVAARNGVYAQYIHSGQVNGWGGPCLEVGATYALTSTGSGLAILSTLSEAEAGKIIQRLNSEARNPDQRVNSGELTRRLSTIRAIGHALASDPIIPGRAEIAMPLPIGGGTPHAIAICGCYKDLISNRMPLVDVLRQTIAAYLDGPSDREHSPALQCEAKAQQVAYAPQFAGDTTPRLHGSNAQWCGRGFASSVGSRGSRATTSISSLNSARKAQDVLSVIHPTFVSRQNRNSYKEWQNDNRRR